MDIYTFMRPLVAAACSYEVIAITSRRTPTVSRICRQHHWLAPLVLIALAIDLYQPASSHTETA